MLNYSPTEGTTENTVLGPFYAAGSPERGKGESMLDVASLAVLQVPIRVWERWAPWVFVASLVLLVVVLVPFIGKGVNGARRWIPLGIMNFQPSDMSWS